MRHHVKLLYPELFVSLLMLTSSAAVAQENNDSENEFRRNKITVAISHTHVPSGMKGGGKSWLMLPSWAIDYDYSLTSKWGIGLHGDLVVQDFSYEEEEGIVKERSKPVSLALVGSRSLSEHFTVFAGGGLEAAPEGTLGLVRLGADCGWEIPGDWEVGIELVWDIKFNAYSAWVFGLGVGKRF